MKRPRNSLVRNAFFAAALFGSTMVGCGAAQRPEPSAPQKAQTTEVKRTTKAKMPATVLKERKEGKRIEDLDLSVKSAEDLLNVEVWLPGMDNMFNYVLPNAVSLKITEIRKESVVADVSFFSFYRGERVSDDEIYLTLKMNDMEIPRFKIDILVEAMKRLGEDAGSFKEYIVNWDLAAESRVLLPVIVSRKAEIPAATFHIDRSHRIEEALSKYVVGISLGIAMLAGEDLEVPNDDGSNLHLVRVAESLKFTVEDKNEKEFVLRVKEGFYKGRTVKLDRSVQHEIDDLNPKSSDSGSTGDISRYYRIDGISVDKKGQLKVELSEDKAKGLIQNEFALEFR